MHAVVAAVWATGVAVAVVGLAEVVGLFTCVSAGGGGQWSRCKERTMACVALGMAHRDTARHTFARGIERDGL